MSGDYVIVEKRDDGLLALEPDTSIEAIRRAATLIAGKVAQRPRRSVQMTSAPRL